MKGLAFHLVRPWICASLRNDVIQLRDYRVATVIDRIVRGARRSGAGDGLSPPLHLHEALIVTGGDDYKIKVWDYRLQRCLSPSSAT